MDKTEPPSEAKEQHECEFYLDNESVVYGCECGDIEISGKTYYPEDKVNLLKEEITRLKAELERERELRKERIYEFLYNSCVHESAWATMSLHRTRSGAKKALWEHMKTSFLDYRNNYKKYCIENSLPIPRFASHEDWCIHEVEIKN
jgi:hypothetical protein